LRMDGASMSLINKMLKDLDARHAAPGRERPALGAGSAVAALPHPLMRHARGAALMVLGAAVCATAWLVLRPSIGAARMAAVSAPIPAPPPILPASVAMPAAMPASVPATTPAPVNIVAVATGALAGAARMAAPAAKAEPAPAVASAPAAAPMTPGAKLAVKQTSPQQDSDNLYRAAVAQYQQGRGEEARRGLLRALELNPANARARQALVDLQIESARFDDAMRLLREGLRQQPQDSGFAMSLARLQLETGDSPGAIATLEKGLPDAGDDAAYNALYAMLLQRQQRHEEAIRHYLVALRTDPAKPTWLVGIGASLQATGNKADAIAAYTRARDGGMLPPGLTDYVEGQLQLLGR
ncbi:lipopolysaccharide assembly protein LapB, partial [Pelomonas sp. KK5]|uniref:tetratricopeptide repeat protein n=1 Tax=Pelomonas sp. KK5 TaxID=1855730 RepID=UPI00117FA65C